MGALNKVAPNSPLSDYFEVRETDWIDICPYNSNTFPRDPRWHEVASPRIWLFHSGHLWDVKLTRLSEFFPITGQVVQVRRKKVVLRLRVEAVFYDPAVSKNCARVHVTLCSFSVE